MGFPLREHILKVVFTFFDYHSEMTRAWLIWNAKSAKVSHMRSLLEQFEFQFEGFEFQFELFEFQFE